MPLIPHICLLCTAQWQKCVAKFLSIPAIILLFGESLKCFYLSQISMDLHSVKNTSMPQLSSTHLTSSFNFRKLQIWPRTFPLCIVPTRGDGGEGVKKTLKCPYLKYILLRNFFQGGGVNIIITFVLSKYFFLLKWVEMLQNMLNNFTLNPTFILLN